MLLDWVANACALYPSNIAVEWGDGKLSYAELHRQANATANFLLGEGLRPGSIVAVLPEDPVRLVVTLLGILRAGCVFAPLDPDSPEERLRTVIARLRPNALVFGTGFHQLAQGVVAGSADGCALIADDVPARNGASEPPGIITAPDAMAYIYHTSGSTGRPKSIAGKLSAVSNFLQWERKKFQVREGTRVSQLTAATFDPYLRDVLLPLSAGGTLCIPPAKPGAMDPDVFLDWIDSGKVNLVHCVPTLFFRVLDAKTKSARLESLRAVLLSGESPSVSAARRWRQRFGARIPLVNLYGATEATMAQFFHVVTEADLKRGFIPIGKPIEGLEAFLSDGEICIQSPHLTLGYYGDPEATREAFGEAGDCYRTGDLAVILSDGNYKLLGRKDHQVKIHGVRVDMDEISAVLSAHPRVGSCVVTARKNSAGETRLAAYVVPAGSHPPGLAELRLHLRQYLPWVMMPSAFIFLDRLPLSTNGKIDREALPPPEPARAAAPPSAGPRNEMERWLAGIWCEVLALDLVGVYDHFLDLGGDSLMAAQIAARVGSHCDDILTPRDILDNPTIDRLARHISNGHGREPQPLLHTPRSNGSGRNLIIVVPDRYELSCFHRLAQHVAEFDPLIHTEIVRDAPAAWPFLRDLPSLIFGVAFIRHLPPMRGSVFCGEPLRKSEEYAALEAAGIPVPRYAVLTESQRPDLAGFEEYVVRKPDAGGSGAEVKLVRRNRVRWKPLVTEVSGPSPAIIVQQFIYTGPRPVSYRVNTLFGQTLYAARLRGRAGGHVLEGPPGHGPAARPQGGSIVSNPPDSELEPCSDREVIQLAERAHGAFPRVPLLGIDILREVPSGRLFVLEANAIGYNWNFAPGHPAWLERQFDGVRKAGSILAEKTRQHAI